MEQMTHYESLRFMLLLPFSMEGGDAADFSRDEILTVLRLAKNIHERAQAAECAAATLGDYVARTEAGEAEVARLTAWIIDADAAFNVNGQRAASLDECAGLVRMCHEGRAAIDEVARLNNELASTLADLIGCDGDEGRDTTEAVARWEAIMGDKWQGD